MQEEFEHTKGEIRIRKLKDNTMAKRKKKQTANDKTLHIN